MSADPDGPPSGDRSASADPLAGPVLVSRGAGIERSPKGEERRAQILRVVEQLLRERPIADIGVGEVARLAKVSRPAFYFYFPSMGSAVAEILWDVFDDFVAGASEFLDGSASPSAAVRRSLERALEIWDEQRHLLIALVDAAPSDPEVRALWDGWLAAFAQRIAGSIEEQRAKGLARPGPEALPLARVLNFANERALLDLVRRQADEEERAATVDALTHAWVSAVYGSDVGR